MNTDEKAKFAAETICEIASAKWKEGSFQFDALTVARAYLKQCRHIEGLENALVAAERALQSTPPAEVTDEWPGCKHGNPEKNCPICDYEDRAHE